MAMPREKHSCLLFSGNHHRFVVEEEHSRSKSIILYSIENDGCKVDTFRRSRVEISGEKRGRRAYLDEFGRDLVRLLGFSPYYYDEERDCNRILRSARHGVLIKSAVSHFFFYSIFRFLQSSLSKTPRQVGPRNRPE